MLAASAFLAGCSGYGPGYGPGGHMMPGGWGGFMGGPILWLILVVVLLLAVAGVGLRGRGGNEPGPVPPRETPLDILKRRYAAGEIDREEFERMKKELEG
jgi:putative membrane protein